MRISEEDINKDQYHHVILSTAEITKYQLGLNYGPIFGDYYGIFKDKLLMIKKFLAGNYFLFASTEDKHELTPVCAFYYHRSQFYSFCKEDILCDQNESQIARVSTAKLLDFIDFENQEKKQWPRLNVPESTLTVPLIDLCMFLQIYQSNFLI